MSDYTVPAENGMRLRHDAKLRVQILSNNRVLESNLVDADVLAGHITVQSIVVPQWHPYAQNLKFRIRARREDILTDNQECPHCDD